MSNAARNRLISGEAWADFCDQLKAAGQIIDRFDAHEIDEQDRAEWYRFLTRLTRNGLERFAENCEPDRPRLRDTPWRQSINFQSPDQDHLLAEFVDGSHEYLIRGNRGGLPYFVIASWNAPQPRNPGERSWSDDGINRLSEFDPSDLTTTGFIMSDQTHFDEEGNFEIVVSQQRPKDGRDWLPMTQDCVGLLVRTLYHDRANTVPPSFTIERLDKAQPRPVSSTEMSDALAKAGQVVLGYGELVRRWWQDNLSQRPNRIRFSREVYLSNGGVPDRHHGFGVWECGEDEALVIEFEPAPCKYWIFQLCTIWQENLDNYEDGDGYVTKFRHTPLANGRVRIIVNRDNLTGDNLTGYGRTISGNHISGFGHSHGGMSLRFIGLEEGADPPAVHLWRLPRSSLSERGEDALVQDSAIISGELTK